MTDTPTNKPSRFDVTAYWLRKMRSTLAFSLIINLLYLTSPIFMMQIYDRVLASANIPTLVGLVGVVLILYMFFGALEYVRSQVLRSNGESITHELANKAYNVSVLNGCEKNPSEDKKRALSNVTTLRGFISSPTFTALFDLPWSPLFLVFIAALHPTLGLFSLGAAAVLVGLAYINQALSSKTLASAAQMNGFASRFAENAQREAVALRGNGMIGASANVWRQYDEQARDEGIEGHAVSAAFSTATKTLRLFAQTLILGTGAYLVIKGELSAGAIIASSALFARVLAPVEQLLGNYAGLVNARESWNSIQSWAYDSDTDTQIQDLPAPKQELVVDRLFLQTPANDKLIINSVSMFGRAGEVIGITGPSGSGKSTLAKSIVGAWPIAKGRVCLDGADLGQWSRDSIGDHIGYVPQHISFFAGTIAENIGRFRDDDFRKVVKASVFAGTHQMILALPDGYNTKLDEAGSQLSGGQRQRLALARAFYNDPFLMVLDEPSSNLDKDGILALKRAMGIIRKSGRITILISHNQTLAAAADRLLILKEGQAYAFGTPGQIVQQSRAAVQQQAAGLKVVPNGKKG